jgi:lipoprotein-anchoring transpeptidase ErfK/SrfK
VQTKAGRFVEQLDGAWLPRGDLFVAERRSAPSGTTERWLHFSIGSGTLVAYEGAEPVFATLASPGIGGNPRFNGNALADRTTPLGTHRLQFKHLTDDMSPEVGSARSFWIADVPFAMYFRAPFAIHVAYWHESFGEPMSGGCINVSPKDGLRLFNWTSPTLPRGWHGVGASKAFGAGTLLRIER